MITRSLTLGTRASKLALWQTSHVVQRLQAAWPGLSCDIKTFSTVGDRTLDKPLPAIGGKGLFTQELEHALGQGVIDLAVHSLKDLPVEDAEGVVVGAIVDRVDVRDVLVAHGSQTLESLPSGAVVGTSSLRRRAQLLMVRPDLDIQPIRGNVETRVNKVHDGLFDATVLAAAGIARLGLEAHVSQWLSLDLMLPAPGQGALAVQCRADDDAVGRLLAAIEDREVRASVTAERGFLSHLGGGCSLPVAAWATRQEGLIHLTGLVAAPDGSKSVQVQGVGEDAQELGTRLAERALAQGAKELLTFV